LAQLRAEGFGDERAPLRRWAALHYHGQSFDLIVPVPAGPLDARMVDYLEEAFGAEHERTYGHRAGPEEPVELVSIRVVGQGLRQGAGVPERVLLTRPEPEVEPARAAYFGRQYGWVETPVLRRSDLASPQAGPLIVEEYDATCLVPPGARASLDEGGNIVIAL
jgi:N-methylhydantoinase A